MFWVVRTESKKTAPYAVLHAHLVPFKLVEEVRKDSPNVVDGFPSRYKAEWLAEILNREYGRMVIK